jgi:hypothetical protein
MKGSEIQRKLLNYVNLTLPSKYGTNAIMIKNDTPSLNGFDDLFMFFNARIILIEVKGDDDTERVEQKVIRKKMIGMGFKVYIVEDVTTGINVINQFLTTPTYDELICDDDFQDTSSSA